MKVLKYAVFSFILVYMFSCTSKNEEEDFPVIVPDTATYVDVEPIISVNCYGCHSAGSNSGGRLLDSYDFLKSTVEDPSAQFVCRINWNEGCNPMPLGSAKMSQTEISTIENWIDNGMS